MTDEERVAAKAHTEADMRAATRVVVARKVSRLARSKLPHDTKQFMKMVATMAAIGVMVALGARDSVPAVSAVSEAGSHPVTAQGASHMIAKPEFPPLLTQPIEIQQIPDTEPAKLVNELARSRIEAAFVRRAERARSDSEYVKRIDPKLNEYRFTIALWVYFEEHGQTYDQVDGSPTVISLDLKTGNLSQVSFSRDVRVPNIERVNLDGTRVMRTMREVYKEGGFTKVREVLEESTGLVIDEGILVKDTVIYELLSIVASIDVTVPKEHDTQGFRMGGKEYGPGFIPAGPQTIDPLQAMRLILAEDKKPEGKKDERSYRKYIVMDGLVEKLKKSQNPQTLWDIKTLLEKEQQQHALVVEYGLDILPLMLHGALNVGGVWVQTRGNVDASIPQNDPERRHVFHDPSFGDGGVWRVHSIADMTNNPHVFLSQSTAIRREVQDAKLPGWYLIPTGGDPYAENRVTGYWGATRQIVKNLMQ